MKQEIERKFLVTSDAWRGRAPAVLFRQGYIARTQDRVARVRVAGGAGFLTIKIRASQGLARDEFEYPIPLVEAQAILDRMSPGEIIEKYRYTFSEQGVVWEVDEFLGANQGLIIAEVELECEDQIFHYPDWLGQEVSRASKYLNVELAQSPYITWPSHDALDASGFQRGSAPLDTPPGE